MQFSWMCQSPSFANSVTVTGKHTAFSQYTTQSERCHDSSLGNPCSARTTGGIAQSPKQTVLDIARAIQKQNVQYVFLTANGTSDNAGRYACVHVAEADDRAARFGTGKTQAG